jgi:hypothetical protein
MKRPGPAQGLAPPALVALLGCGVGPPPLDVSSPQVVSVDPSDGASGVGLLAAIVACLDRPMNPATVTAADVTLSRVEGSQNVSVSVTVSLSADGTCITASPWSVLAPASHYRFELEKGLLSVAGVEISSKTVQFASGFTTLAPAARATMLIPLDGMLAAPLDLSQVLLQFSAPVAMADGGTPFTLGASGGPAVLSADGLFATAPFLGAPRGTAISVALASDLVDASGQAPLTADRLGFTMGSCPENGPPGLGAGLVVARDRDALLQFAVDRPSLCGAQVHDPGCPNAAALASPAQCSAPYDPCNASLLCLCTVPLVGLCAGDHLAVSPVSRGFDGQVGSTAEVSFDTSPALPGLVLTEVRGGSKSTAFVEVQNRSGAPIDLLGLELSDCGLTLGCANPKNSQAFGAFGGLGTTTLQPDAYALLVNPGYTASNAPAGALLLSPLGEASLISLSSTKMQSLAIFSPSFGAVVSSYDGSVLPKAGFTLERVDPAAADPLPGNWSLSTASGGTPGACNSVTAGQLCELP